MTDRPTQRIKIPFETSSSWVVTPAMPATAPVDLVNSGRGTETGRIPTRRRLPGTDPPWGSSEGQIGSCGAGRRRRRRLQVEVRGARRSPLPGSNCHAGTAHPGGRNIIWKHRQTVVASIKAKGPISLWPKDFGCWPCNCNVPILSPAGDLCCISSLLSLPSFPVTPTVKIKRQKCPQNGFKNVHTAGFICFEANN